MEGRMLTVTELMELLNIKNRQFILKALNRKDIKGLRAGWVWLIPASEVEKMNKLFTQSKAMRNENTNRD